MRLLYPVIALQLLAAPALAQCGGDFSAFVAALKPEIAAQGLTTRQTDAFLAGVVQDARVLRADRAQSFFRKDFIEFSRLLVSQNRMQVGTANLAKYRTVFDRVEADYGVSRGVLTAFWGLETDFGAFQGDYNTRDALVTLAHDCRRPELFRPQIMAAARLYARGDFDIAGVGAWAGEIGQVQMLPIDIERNGVDGDGDGHVNLRSSPADALLSGAKMLKSLGWRSGEPWLQEIAVPPDLDWAKTGLETRLATADWAAMGVRAREGSLARGLQGSVLLPMGHKGPAFMAYPNFSVLFEWNQSFAYVTTAAYYATRLLGAPVYLPGNADPLLSLEDMKALQQKLAARGHDVGKIDGILGAMTRAAVQKEQTRLGLPADAWPTPELLRRL
ncbi:MAG: lytic murein transglycosylase [Rhodobacteraceae bacterium]|nr:lytic murein transglycosylase [Paracoccaceae bacterium]